MISAGRVLGALSIQSIAQNAFDNEDMIVLQGVADSLATALENARLFQQAQVSLEETQELHRQYLLESWSNVIAQTRRVSYSFEREPSHIDRIAQTNLPPTTMEIPLVLRGQVIGNLVVEAERSTLTPQEISFIETVTQQTALALENMRLVQETQRTAQQDRVVSSISDELSKAVDVETVLKTAVREFGRLPNISEVSIHIEPTGPEQ
jgi:GAF domain-containing protein